MNPLSKLTLILVVLTSIVASGCNCPIRDAIVRFRTPEVYVPADSVAEIRGPVVIPVWTRVDGKLTKGYVNAYDRYLIGPATPTTPRKTSEVAEVMTPSAK